MNLFIHKIDCLLDCQQLNDTVHAEPMSFAYALAKSPQCVYDNIYIIGKHKTAYYAIFTNEINKHTTNIISLNAIDWLHNKTSCANDDIKKVFSPTICSTDTWILWGGWSDLLNLCREPWETKTIVELTNKWSYGLHLKFALCTDMRYPFSKTIYTNQGRIDIVVDSTQFGEVTELTQCLRKSDTIFNDCKFLPLFTMPMYGNAPWSNIKNFKQKIHDSTGKNRVATDLTFPTRDWHTLGASKIDKFIRYHVNSEFTTSCPGTHSVIASLFRRMKRHEIIITDNNIRFNESVPFFELPEVMSQSIATVAIGHENYDRLGLIPNRVGEAIKAGIFCFIDNDLDPEHILFPVELLSNATYINSAEDLTKRMKFFKEHEDEYMQYCQMQRTYVLQNYDLASYYFAVLSTKLAKHQCQEHCNACERGLL